MSSRLDWDYGICAYSEFVDGALSVGVDLLGSGDQSGRGLDPVQPLGLLSRPLDPDVDPVTATPINGAGALYAMHGSEGVVMPTTDPRMLVDVPEIEKGSTLLYATKQFLYLNGKTRDVLLYQRVGDDKGQSIAMVAEEGGESIQVRHVSGAGVAMLPDGSVLINAETASNFVQVTKDGVVISGLLKLAGGAVFGDVVGAQPVPLGVPYAAAMNSLAAALSALAGDPGLTAAGAACGTAAGAVSAAAAALSTKVAAS